MGDVMEPTDATALRALAEAGDARSQYLFSQECYRNGDPQGMAGWLERAAEQDLPEALDALGYCLEKGFGVEPDHERAQRHYRRAAGQGSPQAAYRLAELLYKTGSPREQGPEICSFLQQAVDGHNVTALRTAGYLLASRPNRLHEGLMLLRRAARLGDAASCFALASLDTRARPGERRRWLDQAVANGYPLTSEAQRLLEHAVDSPAGRTASGHGDEAVRLDPSCLEPAVPDKIEWNEWHRAPSIWVAHDALTLPERAWLIHLASPFMRRAQVIEPDPRDPGRRTPGMQSPVRTSESTFLPAPVTDLIAHHIDRKLARITGIGLECSEPFSILHYRPGQYYKPHVDYFDPSLPSADRLLRDGGQRVASAICYLSGVDAGGGTAFPKLGLEIPARAGSVLLFHNCSSDGRVDRRTLHAGQPVRRGDKWVATKWYRESRTGYLTRT